MLKGMTLKLVRFTLYLATVAALLFLIVSTKVLVFKGIDVTVLTYLEIINQATTIEIFFWIMLTNSLADFPEFYRLYRHTTGSDLEIGTYRTEDGHIKTYYHHTSFEMTKYGPANVSLESLKKCIAVSLFGTIIAGFY